MPSRDGVGFFKKGIHDSSTETPVPGGNPTSEDRPGPDSSKGKNGGCPRTQGTLFSGTNPELTLEIPKQVNVFPVSSVIPE